MFRTRLTILFRFVFITIIFSAAGGFAFAQNGKPPIILVPGITGSELVNSETGETVWFSYKRGDTDDLRLPMSPNLRTNRDNLVPADILRDVKLPGVLKIFPDVEVYGKAIDALKEAGYREGDWNNPQETDVFYLFAYDWRRDNVESAQELIKKIEVVKTKLKRPDLKFDIVAHSMGGLAARYAAMYGAADLPTRGTPRLTWAGEPHINKLLLFGTPNEGSFYAFSVLTKGYNFGIVRFMPYIDDLGKDDVFTFPSLYQLMPHRDAARFLDENLKPINVNLYSAAAWRKYGWGAISDPKFLAKLKDADKIPGIEPVKDRKIKTIDDRMIAETTFADVQKFLTAALNRARAFHQALDVQTRNAPIEIQIYGSACERTLDAVILVRDRKKDEWNTITSPETIHTRTNIKISKETVEAAIYAEGDGRVTKRSLHGRAANENQNQTGFFKTSFGTASTFYACEPHHTLLHNKEIQAAFLSNLSNGQVKL